MKSKILILAITLLFCGCGNSGPNKRSRVAEETSAIVAVKAPINPAITRKPIVNVYVENSGSMDGYVKGVTEFEQAVYSYLSDIKITGITEQLNLFYINSKVIPQGSEIADFIEKLEPDTFKAKGGNRGTSDIANVIKTILSHTSDSTLSILVSDCIFSPGRGRDAQQYLINQQIGVKTAMAEHLEKYKNTAVIVYQLVSQFDGVYFNREDSRTTIKAQRPYYIWVVGNENHIAELRKKVPENKFRESGVQNLFAITTGDKTIDYAIVPNTGEFKLSKKKPKTHIVDARLSSRGDKKLTFVVNANFSNLLVDNNYIVTPDNYEMNDKDFSVLISKCATSGFTHSLKFSSQIVKPSSLTIKLRNNLPSWVECYNDSIGLDINSEGAMGKTYGIKYLFGGIYEAYTHSDNYYTNINLSINNN